MPQQTSIFACSWVPIVQVVGLVKVRVNCFPKVIATWHGQESNPRPSDLESESLTTPPRCPYMFMSNVAQKQQRFDCYVSVSFGLTSADCRVHTLQQRR
ncbi:hypothetical protein ElyMa_003123700 [Elysia marginata]|uniref:Secreted protein n=1 Tax=Elysia marginata TaxID=1093978 RepID=A0AAV4IWQ5_9GAST|nr:hypothetical protein ElyMa_003123700 [Elysia marginata]